MQIKRLSAIGDAVGRVNKIFDVGSDHGYLPIYLVLRDRADFAVASDVNEGPVENAKRNIEKNGLSQRIAAVLGNGFERMDESFDAAVIAGMGGILISQIIKKDINKAKALKRLVLQPMNNQEYLRRFLFENSFRIEKEIAVSEEDKVYNIMVVIPGEDEYEKESYFYLGNPRKYDKNEETEKYIDFMRDKIKKILISVKGIKKKTMVYQRIFKDTEDFYD